MRIYIIMLSKVFMTDVWNKPKMYKNIICHLCMVFDILDFDRLVI